MELNEITRIATGIEQRLMERLERDKQDQWRYMEDLKKEIDTLKKL